ncbi:alcohol dehydrogenase [Cladophialophora psammophila CBS 110553]|uniref:Alcohol dehydrogenase n=1 Tax=Cladophialophora psammophila CBS 110553 TaxID=1182543 RepID=W9WYA9_9EURO|nr:alcohol dehydrogenase [Cladophialophora psammophila CBS 110553]EXJ69651.1 alcohol dehydrogenase [Cladophialophora psammophila CBS 110553]
MSYLFRPDVNNTVDQSEIVFDIPKECKAGVVVNEGPDFHIEVQMVPVPEPGPDEVLIKLNVTGICFSDLHFAMGDLGTPPMSTFGVRSPGHEGAGVVVKVGSNVKNWKTGDRAGMKPRWSVCGDCDLCLDDKESYCRKSVLCGLHKTGTYQQYVTSPAHYTQRIPDGVDDYAAAPIMCSAGTMYRSLRLAGLKVNNWAVFLGGGGGVGIQGVQLAVAMGLKPIVVDTGDEKEKLAMSRGAKAFVDFKRVDDPVAEAIKIADGIGAHGVFVTAGNSYPSAIPYTGTRVGAVVSCIGLPHNKELSIGASPVKFITQGLTVRGSMVGSRADIATALQYAAAGKLSGDHTVYSIDRLPEAVERIRKGEAAGRGVVDFNL